MINIVKNNISPIIYNNFLVPFVLLFFATLLSKEVGFVAAWTSAVAMSTSSDEELANDPCFLNILLRCRSFIHDVVRTQSHIILITVEVFLFLLGGHVPFTS